ncbi:MAG: helix-turn-helix domain-containing protein [Nitrospirae bacterium]|nr:MAG: helix-turn-helix domain-containing protein [Nitrospirota bacterium]
MLTKSEPLLTILLDVRLRTTEEAAEYLRVKTRTLRDRRFRERIGLQPLYLGKRLRFRLEDLKRALNV